MFPRALPELSALLFVATLWASPVAAQSATGTGAEGDSQVASPPETAPAPAPESSAAGEEVTPVPPSGESEENLEETAEPLEEVPPMPAPATSTTPALDSQPKAPPTTIQAGRRIDSDEEPEQPKSCGSGSIALSSGGCTKPWRVIGYAEYRQLAVTDNDPAAGRSVRMFAQASYRVAKEYNIAVWGRVRYLQNFVAEEGETAARFQDPILGVDYMQQLSYADRGQEWANLFLQHRLSGTIPAQRETLATDLYTRVSGLERVRLIPIPSVYVGPDLTAGYNFYRYAEQPGQQGTVNEQADFSGMMVAEWYPFQHDQFGSILLGVDGGVAYTMNYRGRGGDLAQQENRWSQSYAWDLYAYYMPVPQLWLGAAVSQGMGVLRDGVAVVDFANRDATQLSFSSIAIF